MSAATKRKYVIQEFLKMSLPTDSQNIVRIVAARGNNLHEVVTPTGEQYLVSMPTKFRNTIWVKRGDYIVVEPVTEGDKVKGEIVKILTKEHITWYRIQNSWPSEFDEDLKRNGHSIVTNYTKCSDEDLFVNTNRRHVNGNDDDSDSESDSDDDDDGDDEGENDDYLNGLPDEILRAINNDSSDSDSDSNSDSNSNSESESESDSEVYLKLIQIED